MRRVKNQFNVSSAVDIEEAVPEQCWQPPDWITTLENIKHMRKNRDAPVDTMGCDMLADKESDPKTFRLQVLLSLMLSSQTKDELTASTMSRLIRNKVATVDALRSISEQDLAGLLHPVSFYKTKAKHIKKTVEILAQKYEDDIPRSIESLLSLPGVGPKMAHLVMKCAWDQVTGIGVDTHVHRIVNRIQWIPKPTKDPEATRALLESWLPKNLWADVNKLLVGFGQTICTPTRPKCDVCTNAPICPFVNKSLPNTAVAASAKKRTQVTKKTTETVVMSSRQKVPRK